MESFMTSPPRGGGVIMRVKSVKLMYFLNHPFLYSEAWSIRTKYIAVMTEEGPTKIEHFITPGQGFLCMGVAI